MLDPAKILITTDTVGGVWSYSIELARGLSQAGVKVCLATMGGLCSDSQLKQAVNIPGMRLEQSNFALEWMEDCWSDVELAGEWLLELEEQINPDIIHLNGFAHGSLPFRAPKLVVAHSDVLSWFVAVRQTEAPACWSRYRETVRVGIDSADAVVAVSEWLAGAIHQNYGTLRPQAIPNGRFAEEYSYAAKDNLVLGCGRAWDEAKNLQSLDAAAGNITWPVLIAGSTVSPTGGSIAFRHARPLGVLAESELRAWYSRASIYALPARYEPFGLSVLEAALSGCALVLGDIPSLRENWSGAAVFVPPGDPEALAQAVNLLAERSPMRTQMARRAYERGRCFSSKKMLAAYLQLYRDLQLKDRASKKKDAAACE